jgi:hypothetical protein
MGADHTQVGGHAALQDPAKTAVIPPVTAGNDTDIVPGGDTEGIDGFLKGAADYILRHGESGPVRELRTVVYHGHGVVQHGGHGAQRLGDVSAAQNDEALRREKTTHVPDAVRFLYQIGCETPGYAGTDLLKLDG